MHFTFQVTGWKSRFRFPQGSRIVFAIPSKMAQVHQTSHAVGPRVK